MLICGLDISKTHYALVIKETESNITDYTICTTTKTIVKHAEKENIICHYLVPWQTFKKEIESQEAYNVYLCDSIYKFLFKDILSMPGEKGYIAIEGYAVHALGQLLQIAEISGVAKTLFYCADWKLRILDPLSVKLWATNRGNAEKWEVRKEAQLEGLKIPLNIWNTEMSYDISDAYFLMRMLETELKIRNNPLEMNKLNEQQKKVFNRVTKANPTNILATPFIERKNE